MTSELKVVRLFRYDGDSKVKAFVDVSIGDYVVKGLRIMEGEDGLFLGMPREKAKDGKWYNSFYPATPEAKENLLEAVLTAYRE